MVYPSHQIVTLLSGSAVYMVKKKKHLYLTYLEDSTQLQSTTTATAKTTTCCEVASPYSNSPQNQGVTLSNPNRHDRNQEKNLFFDSLPISNFITRAEVARRFLDLTTRSAFVLLDYKLFYYNELEPAPVTHENYDSKILKEERKIYNQNLSKVHSRAAKSLYDACVFHGGLLIKMGQYLSNLNGFLPKEYLDALRPLQDSCDPLPIDVIQKTLKKELPNLSSSSSMINLIDIEVEPLGSASLAQVHRAKLKDGTNVAIKVQRPGLEASTNADIVALQCLSRVIDIFFPGAGFDWLLPEFHQSIAAELDFTQEAKNMQRCSNMVKGYALKTSPSFWNDWFLPLFFKFTQHTQPPKAIVPKPIMELTTPKILTMTYEEGFRITDMEKLKQNSIKSKEVASATCALFSELTFRHGFVHADPHPGNILVRPRTFSSSCNAKKGEFDIVLLDHGMYRRLDDDFRLHYSNLWAGLVSGDQEQALKGVRGMNLDDKYLDIFSIMLVYRLPVHIVFKQKLGSIMDKESRKQLRQTLESKFGDSVFTTSSANSFMESLPRDLLFCLRCNNLVRGLNSTLGGTSLDRFVAFGASASRGSKLLLDSDISSSLPLTSKEANHFTSSMDGNEALRRAKESLNQPVASELLMSNRMNDDHLVLPSLHDIYQSYKVVLRVWMQNLLLDSFLWIKGQKASGGNTINLG